MHLSIEPYINVCIVQAAQHNTTQEQRMQEKQRNSRNISHFKNKFNNNETREKKKIKSNKNPIFHVHMDETIRNVYHNRSAVKRKNTLHSQTRKNTTYAWITRALPIHSIMVSGQPFIGFVRTLVMERKHDPNKQNSGVCNTYNDAISRCLYRKAFFRYLLFRVFLSLSRALLYRFCFENVRGLMKNIQFTIENTDCVA